MEVDKNTTQHRPNITESLRNSSMSQSGENLIKTALKDSPIRAKKSAVITPVHFSGALTKQGYHRQTWKLRHFVLKGNVITYYKNHLEKTPLGTILLDKDSTITTDDTKGKPFCFALAHPTRRTFFLCAKDRDELYRWVDAIQTAIRQQIHEQIEIQCLVLLLSHTNLSEIVLDNNEYKLKHTPESICSPPTPLSDPKELKRLSRISSSDSEEYGSLRSDLDLASSSPRHYGYFRTYSDFRLYRRISAPSDPVLDVKGKWRSATPIKETILLCDVNRTIGIDLVRLLRQYGANVRVAIRTTRFSTIKELDTKELENLGAEVLKVDFEDENGLINACKGVTRVLIFGDIGNVENIVGEIQAIVSAAKKNVGMKQIVKTSFIGCERWHRYAEKMLLKTEAPCTLIRMNVFMQTFLIDGIKSKGMFSSPIHSNAKVSWLDSRDACLVLYKILTDTPEVHLGKSYVLTGPEALTCDEVAAEFSKVAQTDISYMEVGEEMAVKCMSEMAGLPEWIINSHTELWNLINRDDWNATESPILQQLVGIPGTTFSQFCNDYIDVFREEFLKYYDRDSDELMSLFNQFERMRKTKKIRKDVPIMYDGSIDQSTFIRSLGLILADRELAARLFRGFKTNPLSERLSFSEYAAGVGKVMKGSNQEKIELVFKMYAENEHVTEEQFVSMCEVIRRFSSNMKLDAEKSDYLRGVFNQMAGGSSLARTSVSTSNSKVDLVEIMKTCLPNEIFQKILGLEVHIEKSETPRTRRKSKALTISFGHQNWDLAENMLMGIRNAILELTSEQIPEVTDKDFEITKDLPLTRENKFLQFTDFAPIVFHHIRKSFGIQTEDYMKSLAPAQLFGALEEVVSTGRSGSFLYRSSDKKYIIKTIFHEETTILRKYLKDFYNHLINYPNTLLLKVYGLHKMVFQKKEYHFVVMPNILDTSLNIDEQYDLKGSTAGRLVVVNPDDPHPADVSLKDLNFNKKLSLSKDLKKLFLNQIERDCKWLEERNICDYSLLLGISYLDPLSKLPVNTNANSVSIWTRDFGGVLARTKGGEELKEVYFIGLVDILTSFDIKKKSELALKTLLSAGHEMDSFSVQPPTPYRERFIKYMHSIFV